MRVFLHLLLIGLVMLAIGRDRALAQPAPATDKTKVAKQYVEAGLAAQGTGDYDTALTMYSKAYQLVPHPLLIFNMAQAHRLAGHIDQALTLYARYLSEDPHGAQAQTARELVAELRARKAKTRPDQADKDQSDGGVERVTRPPRNEPSDDGSTGGTLVVKARDQSGAAIDDGMVMIDEDPTGKLAGGKLTVTQVAEGRHTVAIEAGGYRRFEETVTMHDGERTRLDALLVEKPAPPAPSSRMGWKLSLGVSLGVTVMGVSFAAYSYFGKVNASLKPPALKIVGEQGASVGTADCGRSYQDIVDHSNPRITSFDYGALQTACTWKTRTYLGYAIGGIGVVGAVVSLIMLTRDAGSPEVPAGTRGKKPAVAIAPIVTPGGGGAALALTW